MSYARAIKLSNGVELNGTQIFMTNIGNPYVSVYSSVELLSTTSSQDYIDAFLYNSNSQSNPFNYRYLLFGQRTPANANNYFVGYNSINDNNADGGFGSGIVGSFAYWQFNETLYNSTAYSQYFNIQNGEYIGSSLTGILFPNNVVSLRFGVNLNTIIQYIAIGYSKTMPTISSIGTGYYFLNITSIYTNTNTSISNNYFWNGHITNIECYVLPELNNHPIMELGLVFLISSFLYMTTRYYKKDIQVMVI